VTADPRQLASEIVRALQQSGHTAYFAGGCVRDELLGLAPKDYDVATDATPQRVQELFPKAQGVGKVFGVMLVRERGITTEIATFREEEGYTDKRRPDAVRFSTPERDAQRRDFTINALFIDPLDTAENPRGRVIDFVDGRRDLASGVIRAVGDPDERLAEDHLRALRAVRFAARFGFTIDKATGGAIARHARELAGVSSERIGTEIRGMLAGVRSDQRGRAAKLLAELELDAVVVHGDAPADRAFHALERLPDAAPSVDALAAWAADHLAAGGDDPTPWTDAQSDALVKRWRRALLLTNDETAGMRARLRAARVLAREWDALSVARQKRLAASEGFPAAAAIVGARAPEAEAAIARDVDALRRTPGGLAPPPLVTGDDLIAAGLAPGPKFGLWLERLYDAQLEGALTSTEQGVAEVRGWAEDRG
jgi:poly(A) polymerase